VSGPLGHLGGQISQPALVTAGSTLSSAVRPRGPSMSVRVREPWSRRMRSMLPTAPGGSGWSQMWSHSP